MTAQAQEGQALILPFIKQYDWQDHTSGKRWLLSISRVGAQVQTSGHRLLVLLDGNLNAVPAALMQHTRMERGVGDLSACTVVGLGYPDTRFYDMERRKNDYLPPLPQESNSSNWQGGHADTFARLLDERLLPWLEEKQDAAFSEVGLLGHSYGGLFTLYKLLHQPGRFHAFFSISPSLWWADGWLLDQLSGLSEHCVARTLYLGIGADERAMPGDDAQRMAMHQERDLQGRFARLLRELNKQRISFTAETLAGEDHGSVVFPAISRAMRWLMRPAHGHTQNKHSTPPP